jgi:proliferating cell nuclear antigen
MFDRPGAEVAEITTTGGVFKPFVNAIGCVDDEAKLRIADDGLHVTLVDPANVLLVDAHLDALAFDSYSIESESTVGVYADDLKSLIRRARKGHSDELTLSVQEHKLSATVSRGYQNHDVVSQGSMHLIDPDSVRQEPDIPDLDYSIETTIDAAPFKDALSYAMGVSEHVELSVKGVNQHTNAFYIRGETDTRDEAAAVDNIDCDNTATALYSADYMSSILSSIASVGAESVGVKFDDEFPLVCEMDDSDSPLSVKYVLSPRVSA